MYHLTHLAFNQKCCLALWGTLLQGTSHLRILGSMEFMILENYYAAARTEGHYNRAITEDRQPVLCPSTTESLTASRELVWLNRILLLVLRPVCIPSHTALTRNGDPLLKRGFPWLMSQLHKEGKDRDIAMRRDNT